MKKHTVFTVFLNVLRWAPLLTLLGYGLLIASLHIQLFPLELIASQLPLIYIALLTVTALSALLLKFLKKPHSPLYALWAVGFTMIAVPAYTFSLTHTAAQDPGQSGVQLTYATYNKLYTVQDLAPTLRHLKAQNPDLLALQEVTPAQAQNIASELGLAYTALTSDSRSAFGTEIALLSRYPIISQQSILTVSAGSVLRTVVSVPEIGETAVYAAHITPPFSQDTYTQGLQSFTTVEAALSQETLPTLLAGDLNTTVFSPKFRLLERHLTSATPHALPPCSWYAPLPGPLLCMRIDHVLFSSDFTFVSTTIGPDTSSDHRSITAVLQYK